MSSLKYPGKKDYHDLYQKSPKSQYKRYPFVLSYVDDLDPEKYQTFKDFWESYEISCETYLIKVKATGVYYYLCYQYCGECQAYDTKLCSGCGAYSHPNAKGQLYGKAGQELTEIGRDKLYEVLDHSYSFSNAQKLFEKLTDTYGLINFDESSISQACEWLDSVESGTNFEDQWIDLHNQRQQLKWKQKGKTSFGKHKTSSHHQKSKKK